MVQKDGKFQFDKDREAAKSYFIDYVNQNTVFFHNLEEKIHYLVENDYYEKELFDQYEFKDVKRLYEYLYAKKFRFPSFMSAFKFYNNYAMKTNDDTKFLERYEDRLAVVSLFLASGDIDKAFEYAELLISQEYQPATPTFLNAGKKRRGELVSCFLLEVDDSMNSIGFSINSALQLSKIGGGVSLNLSKIRGAGEQIKGLDGKASGVLPVMKLFEDAFSYANQLGQRDGSGVVYLNVFHSDIHEFLDTKKINSDEKIRMKTLSLGVVAPNKFFELVEQDKDMYLFYPYTVYKEYGKHLDDMDISEMYDELVDNPNVRKKKIVARDLILKIAQIQMESGYPYIMFVDNTNEYHALKEIGRVKFSNLCSEIAQLSEVSTINDYGVEDEIHRDISCNLGSLNIVNVMKNKRMRGTVHRAMDALTEVSDRSNISIVPSVAKANRELHSVGLGAMNLHGFLAKNKIAYESKEARDFVRTFFMMVNFYSLERSMLIAQERGVTFKDFEKSEYANGAYFDRYLNTDFSPKTERVKQLFEGHTIPTLEDWARLKELVMEHGLYHAYRLAIAPTGSISYLQSSTASIAPITQRIEEREYGDSKTIYPMPYISDENYFYYKEAYDMDMFNLIDLVADVQVHVDQAISTVLFVKDDLTTRDLAKYYIYAQKKGLKTLYYTRTKKKTIDECVSCVV
ncbi:class 1b ribonucleoside-diphosphate reductase subunit alpha [Paenibacillus melissococcoides]|uniref:Ribonucleoside-diphosphate reductase n=1 Tax=Paenibacillus melissococcoides TaxID=2912268 RepID=A0ABN8U4H5_9BACL|nr:MULTISPECIES: class 1b ribonucleoside-diphosphate reductase subunit alpha [Paenibacillus]MEB9893652.1 class 1b ribonucleoside-diphosphate reductase subunit alpha [Bacillus cereus]CAH8244204.1 class 1b ribonucleoside-diphosphate reductase subunit alpha [Paenibacillus melissococcoides]CAH8703663.1 class 1b ribonucleoside-diphosphate reductase subunit alpha [Paenibacillus melissococcoides]CAH8706149.1 class 1b ribonucleoside-diphosphate reductase subunit alpha [Paenibacillus melissococcoides]